MLRVWKFVDKYVKKTFNGALKLDWAFIFMQIFLPLAISFVLGPLLHTFIVWVTSDRLAPGVLSILVYLYFFSIVISISLEFLNVSVGEYLMFFIGFMPALSNWGFMLLCLAVRVSKRPVLISALESPVCTLIIRVGVGLAFLTLLLLWYWRNDSIIERSRRPVYSLSECLWLPIPISFVFGSLFHASVFWLEDLPIWEFGLFNLTYWYIVFSIACFVLRFLNFNVSDYLVIVISLLPGFSIFRGLFLIVGEILIKRPVLTFVLRSSVLTSMITMGGGLLLINLSLLWEWRDKRSY